MRLMRITTDTDRLGDEIAELAAHLHAATHRLLTLIRRFDEAGGWADQGALSCAHWLSWRIGLDLGAAREHVRVARALADLPLVDDALGRGQVSYSKVRALTRVATPATEASLLEMARSSTASQLERICRSYRLALRNASNERPEDEPDRRWVRERETDEGLVRFDAQLRPDEAAIVRRALEAAMERAWDVSAETPPASLRRADALVAVAEQYLAGAEKAAAPPIEVVVHVDADALADRDAGGALDDGTALAPAATDRLLCDASVVEVVEDSRGNVLDVGRRRRTIPTLLRRALRLRDRGCRFPGCTNRHVDGHHVVPWARGGATTLENLCSLCRRHHTYVHEYGFRMERDGAGGFRFFRPDGREVTAAVPAPMPSGDPVEALRAGHRLDWIAIDAWTGFPRWDGRPPDYDHAVFCLVGAASVTSATALSRAARPAGPAHRPDVARSFGCRRCGRSSAESDAGLGRDLEGPGQLADGAAERGTRQGHGDHGLHPLDPGEVARPIGRMRNGAQAEYLLVPSA
jgi:hypothetical protein